MYIIQSQRSHRFYVGYSKQPEERVKQHNDGWTLSTKGRGPWNLVYVEEFIEKSKAMAREREIKRRKSHSYIERLINAGGRPVPK